MYIKSEEIDRFSILVCTLCFPWQGRQIFWSLSVKTRFEMKISISNLVPFLPF